LKLPSIEKGNAKGREWFLRGVRIKSETCFRTHAVWEMCSVVKLQHRADNEICESGDGAWAADTHLGILDTYLGILSTWMACEAMEVDKNYQGNNCGQRREDDQGLSLGPPTYTGQRKRRKQPKTEDDANKE
jgi:hypothetical protein